MTFNKTLILDCYADEPSWYLPFVSSNKAVYWKTIQ